jgi:thiol-disulfide isomerase/thioredoxin
MMTNSSIADVEMVTSVHRARVRMLALAGAGVLGAGGISVLAGCGQKLAPASEFVLMDGSKFSTAQLAGKVAFINFWATSCTSCVAEMPKLVETYQKYAPRGYETLAVAMAYDQPAFVLRFAQSRQLPFKVAFDASGAAAKAWGDVKLTPTSFLLNQQSEIVKTYVGMPDFAELHGTIERLLA